MTDKFREYLLGRKHIVYTDNNPLSHLSSAKLGATEQSWAAQLAPFDFDVKYRSGRSNKNADALLCQYSPGVQDLEVMIPGESLPRPLQQALQFPRTEAAQAAVVALPHHAPTDIRALQHADPVKQGILVFWWQGQLPNQEE